MVSAKMVHLLEDHWEAVSGRFLRLVRNQRGLPHINQMPESELIEACRRLVSNLGHWLLSNPELEIGALYEKIGRERSKTGIPLSESIRGVQLLKEASLSYLRDQGIFDSTVDIYAEEEMEHQLGRFFDLLVYQLSLGYEHAREDAATAV